MFRSGSGLSAKAMLDSAPQQHGVVLKLHVPIIYTILPDFLKRFILSFSFLSFLAPSWKQRYLILCGSFLYKFSNQASTVPKGSPLHVETVDVKIARDDILPELSRLPPGYNSVFSVSTLRKSHFYAVADNDEALTWLRSLHEARQETITRNLGHAANMPYPKAWAYFDSLGKSLLRSKERIQERLDSSRMKDLEMISFAEGAPVARSYYGWHSKFVLGFTIDSFT